MRITDSFSFFKPGKFNFESFVKGAQGEGQSKTNTGHGRDDKGSGGGAGPVTAGGPIPVEPDGGIGDGAGPVTAGGPIPVEPDGGIGDGAGPITADGPIPVEPDGGIGDGAGPVTAGGGRDNNVIIGTRGNDTLNGTSGDDLIGGRRGDDAITTGEGNDIVRGGRGDDVISVTGAGNKRINGGEGRDTLELQGPESSFTVRTRNNGATVYTAADGSRIIVRNIESVRFTGVSEPEAPPPAGPEAPTPFIPGAPTPLGFEASFDLAPNALGVTSLDLSGGQAVLIGPGTNFTFTGVDASGLAADGPIIATGGSGTINGEETTAVPFSPFSDAVLTISSGFNLSAAQSVSATFANGATLNTTVDAPQLGIATIDQLA